MKHLKFNNNFLELIAKKGSKLKETIEECRNLCKNENVQDIELDYNGYLIYIDKDISNTDIERMIKDFNYWETIQSQK